MLIDQLYFPLRIETSNNVFTGHLLVRATAPTKIFKPYAEGFVGFNNFFTTTAIMMNLKNSTFQKKTIL